MKVDEKIREELVEALEKRKEAVSVTFDEFIFLTKTGLTVENIMKGKAGFLFKLVDHLPISSNFCYFCFARKRKDSPLINEIDCPDCEYGKKHGICGQDHKSDWRRIDNLGGHLKNAIKELYYKGEIYADDTPRFKVGDYIKGTKTPNGDNGWRGVYEVVGTSDYGFSFKIGTNQFVPHSWSDIEKWGFVVVGKPTEEAKKHAEESKFKVGDVWAHSSFGKIKITKQDGNNRWGFIYENGHKDGCGIEHFEKKCILLLWRDPE